MKALIATLTATLALTLAFAAAGGAAAAPRVEIHQFKFQPAQLTVPVGTTVTWMNDDEETHTVTASDRTYTSTGLEHAETFSHRFTAPGTYIYFCALHPHMTATIVVR
jgi:plastocyanin